MSVFYQTLRQDNEKRKFESRFRSLTHYLERNNVHYNTGDQNLVNFSSNNYLGLADHPILKDRAKEYIDLYGVGATASRLVCGSYRYHETVETKIASLVGSQEALIFPSGYQANITLLPALLSRHSIVLLDRLCHNSLIMGATLSGARVYRYHHQDLQHLETLLKKNDPRAHSTMVVTESVFSMDGDLADLDGIVRLSKHCGATVFVDDSHSFGIMGDNGMGLAAGRGDIDLILGGFGKGAGASGAYFCCSEEVKEYLVNHCAGFIYTTAPPPAVVGAMDAALDLIPDLDNKREQLRRNIHHLTQGLGISGHDIRSPIIPLIIGDAERTMDCMDYLKQKGLLVQAIRPPTVPEGTSRLRLTVSSEHTQEQLDILISQLRRR